jgi:type IV pilus assembly protein PilM
MMATVNDILERVKGVDLEKLAGLRPAYPPVALEMDRHEIVLVRVKRGQVKRKKDEQRPGPAKKFTLEAHQVRPMPEQPGGGTMLRPNLTSPEEVRQRIQDLFEKTGTRPGRVSLVLPDNLAKISLMSLPERPASRRQLEEIVRFKVRRSVPFRLDEAALSYQELPGEGSGVQVLVALLQQGVIEQYERVIESLGSRVGLIDLCTPNLFNLYREQIDTASRAGSDVALLNCTGAYFSLVIVRRGQVIFFRCKSYGIAGNEPRVPNGTMARELAGSLSYYQEKLQGQGVGTVFVRSVAQPLDELGSMLESLGIERVEAVDPTASLDFVEGVHLDPLVGQRIAPAIGAATGRGR